MGAPVASEPYRRPLLYNPGCVVTPDKRVAGHTLIHDGLSVEIAIGFVIRVGACCEIGSEMFTVTALLLCVGGSHFACFQFLDVSGRKLRTINRDGEFVDGASEVEWYLVILIVNRRSRIGADVE